MIDSDELQFYSFSLFSNLQRSWIVCRLHLKIELRLWSVVWHLSWLFMNSFNKFEAAISSIANYASLGLSHFLRMNSLLVCSLIIWLASTLCLQVWFHLLHRSPGLHTPKHLSIDFTNKCLLDLSHAKRLQSTIHD